jgi:hypothetical protein
MTGMTTLYDLSYQLLRRLMGTRKPSNSGEYRINLRLDPELDSDLISWLESIASGQRSEALRSVIREGIGIAPPRVQEKSNLTDLEAIRFVVADEIRKALKDKRLTSDVQPMPDNDDLESKYGSKLDQMLGGFSGKPNNRG